ncbi:uncharacterized protein LOC117298780 isoform X2 [Asterias rubens]|uniref:uncharacterized protein LOC117298780 isoform X2 n=1 Tax=Asterias rubens TaxID=7604 RepID=UPI001455105B|nr:uncharacterized protein LOC117298780 isoform X2 [Asterias rubens]
MDATSSAPPPRRWIGRGRGVLGLQLAKEKRPGHQQEQERFSTPSSNQNDRLTENSKQQSTGSERRQPQQNASNTNSNMRTENENSLGRTQVQNGASKHGDAATSKTKAKTLLAKYSYKVNPASPLGAPELGVKQGQKLTLVEKHPTNEHWWKVQDEAGGIGFVPASYMLIQEIKISSLPWLEKPKQEEPVVSEKPVFKPYVSAYNKPTDKSTAEKQYYCAICQKQLNGPKPYGAHMTSKAHKEEVEIAKDYEQMS